METVRYLTVDTFFFNNQYTRRRILFEHFIFLIDMVKLYTQ